MARKFDLAPLGDYDFYIGGEAFQVGCFSWFSDDLLDNIAVATAAALTGQKSLDNPKRRYVSQTGRTRFVDHDAPAKNAVSLLDVHMQTAFQAMRPRNDSNIRTITFDQAMVRAFTMIENCLKIARRGYVFECALIARGCLEQIAWARAASRVDNEDELFSISVQKEITRLKQIYLPVGRLYGELSGYAHFDAKLHSLFYTEDGEKLATLLTNGSTKELSMQWPFVLTDIWLIIFEPFYRHKLPKLRGITQDGVIKKRRFPVQLFRKYFGDLKDQRRSILFA